MGSPDSTFFHHPSAFNKIFFHSFLSILVSLAGMLEPAVSLAFRGGLTQVFALKLGLCLHVRNDDEGDGADDDNLAVYEIIQSEEVWQ